MDVVFLKPYFRPVFIIFLLVIMLLLACQRGRLDGWAKEKNDSVTQSKEIYNILSYSGQKIFTVSSKLSYDTFHVELYTIVLNDTLNVSDWAEDPYSNPVVQEQYMIFYHQGKEIRRHAFPISCVERENIRGTKIRITKIPLHHICILKGYKSVYYVVEGADFCNGIDCAEFWGIYSLHGETLYEQISTEGPKTGIYSSINQLENIIGVNMNQKDTCIEHTWFW